jgi:peptidoglycan/xylan/chitin deacetylase (PgdA/CDA1 family)
VSEDGLEYFVEDDLAAILAEGHELGCHSFSHRRGPAVGSASLLDDIDRNSAYLQDLVGDYHMTSFAYPYGEASPRTKALLADRFATSRGIAKGVNAGLMDLSQLRAVGVEAASWDPSLIKTAVLQAVRASGWLIFFTHDVSETPSPYGATPSMLNVVLDALDTAGVEIAPVKHALARVLFS